MNENLPVVTVKIGVVRPDSPEGERKLLSSLSSLQGVQQARLGPDGLLVSYLAELVSQGLIEAELRRVGFTVKPLTRKRKGFFGRFLERMAETNQKTFGGQPLDCCSLQKKKPARRRF